MVQDETHSNEAKASSALPKNPPHSFSTPESPHIDVVCLIERVELRTLERLDVPCTLDRSEEGWGGATVPSGGEPALGRGRRKHLERPHEKRDRLERVEDIRGDDHWEASPLRIASSIIP